MFTGVDFCLSLVYICLLRNANTRECIYESYNYGFYQVRLYFDAVHDLKYFYVFVTEPEAYRLRKSKRKLIPEKSTFQ